MYLSDIDKDDKLGFTGSYSSIIKEIEDTKLRDEIYVPIFTLFLDGVDGLEGHFFSLFLDVNFADESYIIPPMSTIDTFPATLTEEILIQQQVGYKAIIRKRDQYKSSIDTIIIPRFIYRGDAGTDGFNLGTMSASANWKLSDETPPAGPNGGPKFMFQISENMVFHTDSNAPRQKVIDYFSPNMISLRDEPKYQIFAGNEVYFFAYQVDDCHIPFVVVQS